MKKQAYMKPSVKVVRTQSASLICLSQEGDKVYGSGISGEYQLSRHSNDWDDDEDEE